MNVLDVLGDWSSPGGPLYRRLAAAIRTAIDRGHLPPGYVLPPERVMAQSLAVGRSTVLAAYDLLRDEQILESRQGSGTWVSGTGRGRAGGASRESLPGAAPAAGPAIDLATASLPGAHLIGELIGELPGADLDALLSRSGYSPLGLPELRAAIAEAFIQSRLEARRELIEQRAHIGGRHVAGRERAEPHQMQAGAQPVLGIERADLLERLDRLVAAAEFLAQLAEREPRRGKARGGLDRLDEQVGRTGGITAGGELLRDGEAAVGDQVAGGLGEGCGHLAHVPAKWPPVRR